MFADGKRHTHPPLTRSPFPPLGKVNCIPNFVKNRLKHGKSIVFWGFLSNYAGINKTMDTIPYLPFFRNPPNARTTVRLLKRAFVLLALIMQARGEGGPPQRWMSMPFKFSNSSLNCRFPLCFNSTGETLKPGRKRVRHTVIFAVLRVHAGGIDGHIVLTRCGLYRTARYGNRR